MPHAKTCLDCGALIPADKTRCPEHERKRNAAHNAPRAKYRTPAWRKRRKAAVADGCQVAPFADLDGIGGCQGDIAAHHVYNARAEAGWHRTILGLCASHHSRHEADVRAGRDTELRRLVDSLGGRT